MPTPGDLVEVEIQQATEYDLAGTVIPTEPIDLSAGELDLSLR
jgi:hypothetical protein